MNMKLVKPYSYTNSAFLLFDAEMTVKKFRIPPPPPPPSKGEGKWSQGWEAELCDKCSHAERADYAAKASHRLEERERRRGEDQVEIWRWGVGVNVWGWLVNRWPPK